MALQGALTRRFDANEPIVITVTNLRAGDGAINVIPDHAMLGALAQSFRRAARALWRRASRDQE